jgi:hypothetical protein
VDVWNGHSAKGGFFKSSLDPAGLIYLIMLSPVKMYAMGALNCVSR